MNLDRIAAVVRPRSPWEAIDLGATLVRAWWRQLLPSWLAVVLPLWMLVFALTLETPLLAFPLLWWVRPLFDALPLHAISRALFGETGSLSQLARALPLQWLRLAPAYLGFERLDPARSFHLPVRLLEGQTMSARYRRQGVLNRQGHGQAVLLTITHQLLELFLLTGLWILLGVLVPESLAPDWSGLWDQYTDGQPVPWPYHMLWGLVWFIAFSLSEWLYVASGFTLYLNRRSSLEGWDVEIAFKRMALRLVEKARQERRVSSRRTGAAVLLLWGLFWSGLLSGGRWAAAAETSPAPPDPQQAVAKVLADPAFGETERVKTWRWRFEPEDREPTHSAGWVEEFWSFVGGAFELVLWGLVGLAIAWLLVYWLKNRAGEGASDPEETVLPDFLARSGLTNTPQSLPRDVPAEARRLASEGQVVEALSLLYRATLLRLAKSQTLELEASWTEGECVRRLVRQAAAGAGETLTRLTRAWQDAAYAHRPPSREEIDSLCDSFQRHIAPA